MSYVNARIHVIATERGVRFLVRDLLRDIGFNDIVLGSQFEEIRIAVTENQSDLMIIGTYFPDGDPMEMIEAVRRSEVGTNPFLAMMAITTDPHKTLVRKVADSGADDLLVYPLSLAHLQHRIDVLIEKRKKFLVTTDYMGPDRRVPSSYREGQDTLPLFDAPNILRARVKGDISVAQIHKDIQATLQNMEGCRIIGHLRKVCWLIDRIAVGYTWADGGLLEPEVGEFIDALAKVSHKAVTLLEKSEREEYLYLCSTIREVALRVQRARDFASEKDKLLLPELSKALKAALTSQDTAKVAREIQRTVKKRAQAAS